MEDLIIESHIQREKENNPSTGSFPRWLNGQEPKDFFLGVPYEC